MTLKFAITYTQSVTHNVKLLLLSRSGEFRSSEQNRKVFCDWHQYADRILTQPSDIQMIFSARKVCICLIEKAQHYLISVVVCFLIHL